MWVRFDFVGEANCDQLDLGLASKNNISFKSSTITLDLFKSPNYIQQNCRQAYTDRQIQ